VSAAPSFRNLKLLPVFSSFFPCLPKASPPQLSPAPSSHTNRAENNYDYGTGSAYALGSALSVATWNSVNGDYGRGTNTLTTNQYIWRANNFQRGAVLRC
jgi:hypothetical protein